MAIEKPINEILISIEKGEYTIPEFQRGFVWNPSQVKNFIRSLYLGYPTGSFLIWKTEAPSKTRGEAKEINSVYHYLILDGQQRLTTIYTIFKGKTPSWYEGVSLRTDLHFNLESEEFQYYKPTEMRGKKEWLHISNYLNSGGLNNFIQEMMTFDDELRTYYQNKILQLKKLDDIRNYGYYIKEIQIEELDKIVEIFNLVNSSGTTLTESDLAMAIVSSRWPEIKEEFRKADVQFKKYDYEFDFGFFIRCLNVVACERGLFSDIRKMTDEDLRKSWTTVLTVLNNLINIFRENAYVDSLTNFSTVYVLYTLVYYVSKNGNKFQSKSDLDKFIYWMLTSQLWGRYSGSSEAELERDIADLKRTNSVDTLINNLKMFRGSHLELSPDDFYLQGTNSRLFNIFYAAIRSQEARDWTDPNMPLYSKNIGRKNKLEKHHIFPKSLLYEHYSSKNTIDKRLVNEIANMAFLTENSNKTIYNNEPIKYLPHIDKAELRKQFIPLDEELWKLQNYEDFLSERRRLLSEGINKFLNSYYQSTAEPSLPKDLDYLDRKINDVELALRDKIDQVLSSAAEENPYEEFVPTHTKEKIKDRLENWIRKNPGEDRKHYNSLRAKLDFFDLQEYRDLISSKNNWIYFEEIFGSKGSLETRFNQLCELRNAIRHSRGINETLIKDGEAALTWFNSILKTYRSKELIEITA